MQQMDPPETWHRYFNLPFVAPTSPQSPFSARCNFLHLLDVTFGKIASGCQLVAFSPDCVMWRYISLWQYFLPFALDLFTLYSPIAASPPHELSSGTRNLGRNWGLNWVGRKSWEESQGWGLQSWRLAIGRVPLHFYSVSVVFSIYTRQWAALAVQI